MLRKLSLALLITYSMLTAYTIVARSFGAVYLPFYTPLISVLAFGFAVLHSRICMGWRRALLLLGTTFAVCLLFECVGVATGLVYGPYHYTGMLGYKFLDLVPLIIPVAWFMMSYPSFVIAVRIARVGRGGWAWRLRVAALGALAMTAWDLAMDPMMVAGEHWIWEKPGAFFGVPLQNYIGWWLTIFVAFLLFLALARPRPDSLGLQGPGFARLAVLSYAIGGLSTVITDLQLGLGGPALAGLFAMLPWIGLGW